MSQTLEIYVNLIACDTSNEKTDEIYLFLEGEYLDRSGKIFHRLPNEKYWLFHTGDEKTMDESLFYSPVQQGLTFRLVMIEQDAHGMIQSLRMLNDFLGEIKGRVLGSGEWSLEPGKYAELVSEVVEDNEGDYLFRLSGADSSYRLGLKVELSDR